MITKEKIDDIIDNAQSSLLDIFSEIDKICEYNQEKVLNAFIKNKIGEEHFYTVTGYGHDDIGREALDCVFADIFKAEASIVRPHFVSGTHTLSCALFGILRHGDTLMSVVGEPYDTMQQVIGYKHKTPESLYGHGVNYVQVDMINDQEIDYEGIKNKMNPSVKMVLIQRSRGYSIRKPISIDEIGHICALVKSINPDCVCFVDNCYGEFTEKREPIEAGADLIAGSLIKNPGGGIVEAGGYIAGKRDLVELCASSLTAPGIATQGGAMFNQTRIMLQGIFMAPSIVKDAYKGAILAAKVFEDMGFNTFPKSSELRTDLIQTIMFEDEKKQATFCKVLQKNSPVDSHLTPIPDSVPGYDDKLIMAGGSFIEGSTIELSADGPVRPPYAVYMQGGLNYAHVKIALRNILKELC